jgi:hypothetical protein
MICEAIRSYISHTAQVKKLNDMVMSLLENTLGIHHHVHQGDSYNSVHLEENTFKHKIKVSGTMRSNGGIPKDSENEAKELKKGPLSF